MLRAPATATELSGADRTAAHRATIICIKNARLCNLQRISSKILLLVVAQTCLPGCTPPPARLPEGPLADLSRASRARRETDQESLRFLDFGPGKLK
jgi:hypothetical protein